MKPIIDAGSNSFEVVKCVQSYVCPIRGLPANLLIGKVTGTELFSCTGSDLVKRHGWPENESEKSVPASYLTGYALGKAAVTAGHDSAVLDIGLSTKYVPVPEFLQPSKEWSMLVWKFHMVMRYSLPMSESKETISMIKSQRV